MSCFFIDVKITTPWLSLLPTWERIQQEWSPRENILWFKNPGDTKHVILGVILGYRLSKRITRAHHKLVSVHPFQKLVIHQILRTTTNWPKLVHPLL
jgi:hypothetical protein